MASMCANDAIYNTPGLPVHEWCISMLSTNKKLIIHIQFSCTGKQYSYTQCSLSVFIVNPLEQKVRRSTPINFITAIIIELL